MKKRMVVAGLVVAAQILGIAGAAAGPWEDGMASYNSGDYMPAIRLFRPLAEQGNARAQHLIGVMYHRGQRGWRATRCALSPGSAWPRRMATARPRRNCAMCRKP
jgi:hypothetical protein